MNGDGSNVTVHLTIATKPHVNNYSYNAYATYDQGSAIGTLYYPSITPTGLAVVFVLAAGVAVLLY